MTRKKTTRKENCDDAPWIIETANNCALIKACIVGSQSAVPHIKPRIVLAANEHDIDEDFREWAAGAKRMWAHSSDCGGFYILNYKMTSGYQKSFVIDRADLERIAGQFARIRMGAA